MAKIDINEISSQVTYTNEVLRKRSNVLVKIIEDCNIFYADGSFSGSTYSKVKILFGTVYVSTAYCYIRAYDEFISANNKMLSKLSEVAEGVNPIDTDELQAKIDELNRLDNEISRLENDVKKTYYIDQDTGEEKSEEKKVNHDQEISSLGTQRGNVQKLIDIINAVLEADGAMDSVYSNARSLLNNANNAESQIRKIMFDQVSFDFVDFNHYDFASLLCDVNENSLATTSSIVGNDIAMFIVRTAYSKSVHGGDTSYFDCFLSDNMKKQISELEQIAKEAAEAMPGGMKNFDIIYEAMKQSANIKVLNYFPSSSSHPGQTNCIEWSLLPGTNVYDKYYEEAFKVWGGNRETGWKDKCTIYCVATTAYMTGFSVETVAEMFRRNDTIGTNGSGSEWGNNQTKRDAAGLSHFKAAFLEYDKSNGKYIVYEKENGSETRTNVHDLDITDIKAGMVLDTDEQHVLSVTSVNYDTGDVVISENWSPQQGAPMKIHTYTVNCKDGNFSGLIDTFDGNIKDFVYTDTIYQNGEIVETADPDYVPKSIY